MRGIHPDYLKAAWFSTLKGSLHAYDMHLFYDLISANLMTRSSAWYARSKGVFREVFMRFFSSFFFSQVKGCIGVFLLIIPSLFLYLVLFAWLFVSIFPPFRAVRFVVVQKLYNLWIGISKFLFDLFSGVEFEIVGI